jgi:hypothetical protein
MAEGVGAGLSFVALLIAEVIWNWKAMSFGDNVARSILTAAVWSVLFACCDAVFIRLFGRT